MTKRVGVTTNPEQKEKEWRNSVIDFSNWKIHYHHLTYDQALSVEEYYRDKGFIGDLIDEKKPGSVYSIYTFEYMSEK